MLAEEKKESGKKLDETQRDPQEDRKYIIRRRAVSIVSFLILIGFFAVVAIYVASLCSTLPRTRKCSASGWTPTASAAKWPWWA